MAKRRECRGEKKREIEGRKDGGLIRAPDVSGKQGSGSRPWGTEVCACGIQIGIGIGTWVIWPQGIG